MKIKLFSLDNKRMNQRYKKESEKAIQEELQIIDSEIELKRDYAIKLKTAIIAAIEECKDDLIVLEIIARFIKGLNSYPGETHNNKTAYIILSGVLSHRPKLNSTPKDTNDHALF